MAPHIVAWGFDKNKRSVSPVPSTVESIVSIESITSDPSIISHSVPEVSTDFLRRKVPPGVHLAADSPFVRHEKYFFQDGNITFLVRECSTIGTRTIHNDNLRSMAPFTVSTATSSLVIQSISLAGLPSSVSVSTRLFPSSYRWEMSNARTLRPSFPSYILSEFGRPFLSFFLVIEACVSISDFEGHALSYERWKSVLHLSTRWGFASLRRLALGSIEPPTPFDQLLLARAYSVDQWLLPALSALCERTVPLSLNEARQMGIEDVVLVTTVREDIRHHALQVDPAEIPHCIEAAQAGMVAIAAAAGARAFFRPDSRPKAKAPSSPSSASGSESGSTGSTAAFSAAKYNYKATAAEAEDDDDDDGKTAVAISPVEVRRAAGKKGGAVGQMASPVPIRPAERPVARPTSAWGKILVVPSPTLSVQPHAPAWGTGVDRHHESHDPSAWRRLRVKTTRRSSPESVAGDGPSDEE